MKAIIAVVLVLAVAVNGGVVTHEIHDVALHAPLVHSSAPLLAPATVIHTSSSSSYKVRAPAAKIAITAPIAVAHAAPVAVSHPSLPLFHARNHGIYVH